MTLVTTTDYSHSSSIISVLVRKIGIVLHIYHRQRSNVSSIVTKFRTSHCIGYNTHFQHNYGPEASDFQVVDIILSSPIH
jgi:hypothetical protein